MNGPPAQLYDFNLSVRAMQGDLNKEEMKELALAFKAVYVEYEMAMQKVVKLRNQRDELLVKVEKLEVKLGVKKEPDDS